MKARGARILSPSSSVAVLGLHLSPALLAQPVVLRGLFVRRVDSVWTDPFPDPEATHHRHGRGAEDRFDPFEDPFDIEWVYVLVPDLGLIEVWVNAKLPRNDATPSVRWSGRRRATDYGIFTRIHVADVPVDREPDWPTLEDHGRRLRTAILIT